MPNTPNLDQLIRLNPIEAEVWIVPTPTGGRIKCKGDFVVVTDEIRSLMVENNELRHQVKMAITFNKPQYLAKNYRSAYVAQLFRISLSKAKQVCKKHGVDPDEKVW